MTDSTLTFTINIHPTRYRWPGKPADLQIHLWRDGTLEADMILTASDRGWYLVNNGWTFTTPQEAGEYLVSTWDVEPTLEQVWEQQRAEQVYRYGCDYASGIVS